MSIKGKRNTAYFLSAFISAGTIAFTAWLLWLVNVKTQSGAIGYFGLISLTAILTSIKVKTQKSFAVRLFLLVLLPYVGAAINLYLLFQFKPKKSKNHEKVRLWVDKQRKLKEGKNEITYFTDGKSYFDDLICEIEKAKTEVLIFSYIFTFGKSSTEIFNALFTLLQRGVKVTLSADYFGSGNVNRSETVKALKKDGLRVIIKNKPFPLLYYKDNSRYHAKVVVIDKKIVYLSSANTDDKSLFEDENCAVKIKGNVADYYDAYGGLFGFEEKEPYVCGTSYPILSEGDIKENGLYSLLISKAENSVKIVTPYLSFDEEVKKIIENKAKKGVKISFIVPCGGFTKTDSLTKYFVETAQSVGAEVYFYDKKFLHKKMIIVDDYLAVTGSNNFDLRSGYAVESLTISVDNGLIAPLLKDFDRILKNSVTKKTARTNVLLGKVYSLMAPLV